MKKSLIILVVFTSNIAVCQNWQTNILNNGIQGTNLCTSVPAPINIFTNNEFTSLFSVNNTLSGLTGFGDGLRIRKSAINGGGAPEA